MLPLAVNKKWSRLEGIFPPILNEIWYLTSINQHEFIILDQTARLHRFNVHNEKWTEIKLQTAPNEFENKLCYFRNSLSFNQAMQRLYSIPRYTNMILNPDLMNVATFDVTSGEYQNIVMKAHRLDVICCTMHTDEGMHLIGSTPKHLQYSNDYKTTRDIMDFRHHEIIQMENYISVSTAVYVPSMQMILLIGCDGYPSSLKFIGIWVYSLLTKKWTKLPIDFNLRSVSAVLTTDERHIIIAGRMEHSTTLLRRQYLCIAIK